MFGDNDLAPQAPREAASVFASVAARRKRRRTASACAGRPRGAPDATVFTPTAPGSADGVKLLVLATEAVDAAAVRGALGDEDLEGAQVLVVSPAVSESPVAFWMSDSDEAIAEAESAAAETAAALAAEGARTRATAGESEPLLALQDALATYPADRVLVFVRGDDAARYREDDVIGEAERRFGVPVTEVGV